MYNDYLQILGLKTGASEQDIKVAYRRLAKQYHPDLNKNEQAKQQFLKITEAYKFLLDVGPRPGREHISYDYNPYQEIYDEWREKARAYAQQRAAEEAAYRQGVLNKTFCYFNYITAFVLGFNALIILDNFLPAQAHRERVMGVSELHYRPLGAAQAVHMYDEVKFTNFKIRVEKNTASDIRDNRAVVYTSPVLNFIKHAEIQLSDEVRRLYPEYGIYYIFRFLIPLTIVFGVAYYFLHERHVNKITVLVVVATLSLMEVALIFSFRY